MSRKGQGGVLIRASDGRYWLQTEDADGRRRSSYIGHLADVESLKDWCAAHDVPWDFRRSVRDGHLMSNRAVSAR